MEHKWLYVAQPPFYKGVKRSSLNDLFNLPPGRHAAGPTSRVSVLRTTLSIPVILVNLTRHRLHNLNLQKKKRSQGLSQCPFIWVARGAVTTSSPFLCDVM